MVPLIGFCGASGSGKTTLAEKIIFELRKRGYQVGAIKHHGHNGSIALPEDFTKKDTSRFQAAGSCRTILSHQDGIMMSVGDDALNWQPDEIASRLMYDMDIVIVEGFKRANIDKIEVVGPGEGPILPAGGKILALARRGGSGKEGALRVLDADNTLEIADFILAIAMRQQEDQEFGVKVKINARKLPVNGFSQRIIENTIRGLLAGFKGGDMPGSIEVLIEPKNTEK